ncbi:carotenoid 1,2-hydratase [Aquibium sp. A9E412]|uniref:carotenoid 1,2-hydratase n=1 Tax=Aquibium sp. A9E412 TaxID=2976767 RepID=UPI0025B27597|nr:carotenoid 1,2-hydratase [Aquibium sp. A9E412]MDN2566038.1 carotenoid 1,2-hydratase [Aquibium sp. A9E412]
MFSPYYAWAGRRRPDDHVCINVALYAPGADRWSMTERGRAALARDAGTFRVGPSALAWDGTTLTVAFDEVSLPRPPRQWWPRRMRGTIRVTPRAVTGRVFDIDAAGRHRWWPVAPTADIALDCGADGPRWRGHGYLDSNWGEAPLETGFARWDWARARLADGGAAIVYDTTEATGHRRCLALRVPPGGEAEPVDAPVRTRLAAGFWGVARYGHGDAGALPAVRRTLEDGPFYTRSLVATRLFGEPVTMMHESFSGHRFGSPLVKLMLPFRMPRRTGSRAV